MDSRVNFFWVSYFLSQLSHSDAQDPEVFCFLPSQPLCDWLACDDNGGDRLRAYIAEHTVNIGFSYEIDKTNYHKND